MQLRFQWAFSKQKACVRSLSPPCRTRAVPYIWVARGRLEMLATRALPGSVAANTKPLAVQVTGVFGGASGVLEVLLPD